MIHIVNPQTHEILDYITLKNVIDDNHKKNLETYLQTYDAIVLGHGRYDKHLEKRNLVIIPDEDGTLQEFVLFEVDKYRDTEGRKTHFYAHASYLDLKKANIIYPGKHESLTASQLGGIALNNTGWQIGQVEASGTRTMTIENYTSPYEFIKRIAREFEVELRFRVETDGQRITGRYVDLLERIGEWRGRQVEFGRDLDGIRRVEKQDIVTALLGLGPENENGNRIEVLVEDADALQRWGRVDEYGNLHHLIEPYEIQSDRQEMTETEARQYTRTALDKRINTQISYETTVIDLEEVPGMSNKKIRFGDTLQIKDTEFNPPLYLEARVYEMVRSLKFKAKKDIKLGDYIEYTEEQVDAVFNQLRNEIRRRLNKIAVVSINSSAGNVFKNAEGTTELTARTFVSGSERDEDGTLYDYQWMKFDKDGNHDESFYDEGKTITVESNDIDEKATYRVLVSHELEVINTNEITISNVFDGADGAPGQDGQPGKDGKDGEQGPPGEKGEDGKGIINAVVTYQNHTNGNTAPTGTWSSTIPTAEKGKYLWTRTVTTYTDNSSVTTYSVAYMATDGQRGDDGKGIDSTTIRYQIGTSGTTAPTGIWSSTVPSPVKGRYLWTRIVIEYTDGTSSTSYSTSYYATDGQKGEKGDKGDTGAKGSDGKGVGDIVPQYYKSTSSTTQSGGSWSTTKPTWEPNRYLWRRDRITYTNPSSTEYTTPVLDDSWQAITTADGKNTVFYQSSQPSTSGRKIGDVWFKTNDGNRMYRFNGTSWVSAQFGENAIVANSITANHIKSLAGLNVNDQFVVDANGNVAFSGQLEGATGTFSGSLVGGSITSNTVIDVSTDLHVGNNIFVGGEDNPSKKKITLYNPTNYPSWEASIEVNGSDEEPGMVVARAPVWSFDASVSVYGDFYAGKGIAIASPNGDALSINKGIDTNHGYIEFYKGSSRLGYIGNPSSSSNNLTIGHSGGGDIQLTGANVRVGQRLINQQAYSTTTSAAANGYVASNGYFARSSSAKKYKKDIAYEDVDYKKVLDIKQASWFDKSEVEQNGGSTEGLRRYYGAIADDFEKVGLEGYTVLNEETGEIENFSDRAWLLLIPNINDILERLERLESE